VPQPFWPVRSSDGIGTRSPKKPNGADRVGPEKVGAWRLPWGGTARSGDGDDNELDAVNLVATAVLLILALGWGG